MAAKNWEYEVYRCRACGAVALGWPEEIVHLSTRCPGKKRGVAGPLERVLLAPVCIETVCVEADEGECRRSSAAASE